MPNFVTLFAEANDRSYSNCFFVFLSFENTYCQQKNIIIYKVRPIVAEVRISIFINCFFVFY